MHPPTPTTPPPQARTYKLDVVQQRDRSTGEVFYILNNSQRFCEGYLQRVVAIKSLQVSMGGCGVRVCTNMRLHARMHA